MTVVEDEEHEDVSPEELAEELPPLQPRYVVYSYEYKHDDGRVSYPLCFIFISPQGELPPSFGMTPTQAIRSMSPEELPPLQPRYVVYSYEYKHDDGRVSYPLCFMFISPQGELPPSFGMTLTLQNFFSKKKI